MTRTILQTALPFAFALTIAAGSATAKSPSVLSQPGSDNAAQAATVERTSIETFYKMIDAAGIDGKLAEKGPLTIFAPTDAAFADWSADQKALILDPKNKDQLSQFLSNHMISGINNPKLKSDPMFVKSLGDTHLAINLDDGFTVNGTRVIDQGIMTKYGLVHVIEEPLTPLL